MLPNPPNPSAPIPSRLPDLADWRQPGPIQAVRRRLGFGLGGGGRRGTGLVDASPPRVTAAPGLEISSAWITGAAAAAAEEGEEAEEAAAATVAAPISSLPGGRRYRVPLISSQHFRGLFFGSSLYLDF